MKKVFILFSFILYMFSCEDDQIREVEDCAGVTGGDNVCGCTDDQAMNFDSTATFDDGSCEYADNLDCAGVPDGNNICGCMDNTAVNYNSLATFDDGSCQYYNGSLSVVWAKTYGDNAGELWSIRPVSDGQNNFGRLVEKTQWENYLEDESSGNTRITLKISLKNIVYNYFVNLAQQEVKSEVLLPLVYDDENLNVHQDVPTFVLH